MSFTEHLLQARGRAGRLMGTTLFPAVDTGLGLRIGFSAFSLRKLRLSGRGTWQPRAQT